MLLHNPRPFDELWNAVPLPETAKYRWPGLLSGEQYMRLKPGVPNHAKPVWVEFGYANTDRCLPEGFYLAGTEVFSVMIQFPNWIDNWGRGVLMGGLSTRLSAEGCERYVSLHRKGQWLELELEGYCDLRPVARVC